MIPDSFITELKFRNDIEDVISPYVYRRGVLDGLFCLSTAVDFFTSVINLILICTVNKISSKVSETSLW